MSHLALGLRKKGNGSFNRAPEARRFGGQFLQPLTPGSHRMRSQIGAAAVKQQGAPASAEGRNAAVAVLQIKQPADASQCCGADGCVDVTKIMQSQEGAGGVVRVRHAAGQITPRPSAGAQRSYTDAASGTVGRAARPAAAGDLRNRVVPASH